MCAFPNIRHLKRTERTHISLCVGMYGAIGLHMHVAYVVVCRSIYRQKIFFFIQMNCLIRTADRQFTYRLFHVY